MKIIKYRTTDGQEFDKKSLANIVQAEIDAKQALKNVYQDDFKLAVSEQDAIEEFIEDNFSTVAAIFEIYFRKMNSGSE